MKYSIGVDLGGTGIKVGLVERGSKQIISTASAPTNAPRSPESICVDIVSLSKKVAEDASVSYNDIEWIGIATPGIVKDNTVVLASNLGWENVRLADILSGLSGKDIFLANDANTAAYAEAIWGNGVGSKCLVAITLGTGVGGGIVIDGKIFEGVNGFAAEMGHVILDPRGRKCVCGKSGCLEAYCSATAIIKASKAAMLLNKDSAMWQLASGNLDNVNGKTPFDAKELGDKTASDVVEEFIDYLAVGVSNFINILQPDVVCIGGGISRQGDNLIKPLADKVECCHLA
jgi:glucokinase